MKLQPKFLGACCAVLVLTGCVSRYQYEVDQALLLQENQKLEQALYLTHYQLADSQRENVTLRRTSLAAPTSNDDDPLPMVIESPRRRRVESAPPSLDSAPIFSPSAIPTGSGSSTPPPILQDWGTPVTPATPPATSPTTPVVPPVARPALPPASFVRPPRLAGTDVPVTVIDSTSAVPVTSGFPEWGPTR